MDGGAQTYEIQVLIGQSISAVEPLLTTARDHQGAAGLAPHERALALLEASTVGLVDAEAMKALGVKLAGMTPLSVPPSAAGRASAAAGGAGSAAGAGASGRDTLFYVVDVDTIPGLGEATDGLPAAYRSWRFQSRASDASALRERYRALHWSSVPVEAPPPPQPRSGAPAAALKPLIVHPMLTDECPRLSAALASARLASETRGREARRAKVPDLRSHLKEAIKAAEAEGPGAHANVTALSAETDPVPEPSEDMLPTDLVPLPKSDPAHAAVLAALPRGSVPVRIRRVNVPEREQLFSQYVASLPARHQQQVRSYHGTPQVAWASSIARTGPDLRLAGSNVGKVYGAGFYTDKSTPYPLGIAGTGSLLVLQVAPGRTTPTGNSSTTAGDLKAAGFDSVAPGNWHILFHPDAVRVDYIADYSLGEAAEEKRLAIQAAYLAAVKKRDVEEMVRKAKLQKASARMAMITQYVKRCESLQSGLSEANVEMRSRLAFLEAQQFKQGLPMYARKDDIVKQIRENRCSIVIGGTGTGKVNTFRHLMI